MDWLLFFTILFQLCIAAIVLAVPVGFFTYMVSPSRTRRRSSTERIQ